MYNRNIKTCLRALRSFMTLYCLLHPLKLLKHSRRAHLRFMRPLHLLHFAVQSARKENLPSLIFPCCYWKKKIPHNNESGSYGCPRVVLFSIFSVLCWGALEALADGEGQIVKLLIIVTSEKQIRLLFLDQRPRWGMREDGCFRPSTVAKWPIITVLAWKPQPAYRLALHACPTLGALTRRLLLYSFVLCFFVLFF